mgnify:CR=1 FL=1
MSSRKLTLNGAGLANVDATVKAIYHSSAFYSTTSDTPEKEVIGVLLDKTNFYAESGGQENDMGRIDIDGQAGFVVQDVQVYNGYVLHVGYVSEGALKVGDAVVASTDEVRFLYLWDRSAC